MQQGDGVVLWQGKVSSEPGPLITRLAEWSGAIDLAGIEAWSCGICVGPAGLLTRGVTVDPARTGRRSREYSRFSTALTPLRESAWPTTWEASVWSGSRTGAVQEQQNRVTCRFRAVQRLLSG